MMIRRLLLIGAIALSLNAAPAANPRQLENLNRSLFAVKLVQNHGVYAGWRLLGTDFARVGFSLYRNGVKINANVITDSTNFLNAGGTATSSY